MEKFPTPASRLALTGILEQEQCFYEVRMQACFCLAKVCVNVGGRDINIYMQCQAQLSPWIFALFLFCTRVVEIFSDGAVVWFKGYVILSNAQQGATPLVSKENLIALASFPGL